MSEVQGRFKIKRTGKALDTAANLIGEQKIRLVGLASIGHNFQLVFELKQISLHQERAA